MLSRSEQVRELLGSRIRIVIIAQPERQAIVDEAIRTAFEECARIERSFSRFLPTSEIGCLNRRVGERLRISRELFLLLSFCEEMRQETNGAFDASILSILEGWGYDAEYSLQEKAAGKTGRIELFGNDQARLSAPVDLGGIGKGYAMDRMLLLLQDFPNLLIDAGGDLYARGQDEHESPWKVAFEHPIQLDQAIGELRVDNLFLASSSPARRKWRNRHHLVDPDKCFPAENMLITYVQAQKGILADAWSTTFFVMGYDQAKLYLQKSPVEAALVGKDGSIAQSPGFEGQFYQ